MSKKNIIILLIIELAFSVVLMGQCRSVPDWNVDTSSYQFNASVIARVQINNEAVNNLSSILAAFDNEECRGVASPITFEDELLYFLTVYSNVNGEELSFRFYQEETDTVIELEEFIVFESNQIYGSVLEPLELNGYIDYDNPPILDEIPDQIISFEDSFSSITLNDYLTELDGDIVVWSAEGFSNLQVDISGDTAVISRIIPEWTGSEFITFTATDQTENALYQSDTVEFTVLPEDHPPLVYDIPDQTIAMGQEFTPVNLTQYLEEIDNDVVMWSYFITEGDEPQAQPEWNVNPADYEFTMNMTIQVISEGYLSDSANNMLGIFYENECRGVSFEQSFMDEGFFFLTVYSNTPDEVLTFRFYDSEKQKLLPVREEICFISNGIIGSPVEPYLLRAGNIFVEITDDDTALVSVIDESWFGSETLIFTVTDQFTEAGYSASDDVCLTILEDHAPMIEPIDEQIITVGENFEPLPLDDYLIELDGDEIVWSCSAAENLTAIIDDSNIAQVLVNSPEWTGSESVIFTATDQTEFAATGSISVAFTVCSVDHPPIVEGIPDQTIANGMQFEPVILNEFLTELDGDQILWTYDIQPEEIPEQQPDWEVNPEDFEFSINLTVEIISEGYSAEGNNHSLFAKHQNQCRGYASAQFFVDKWLYFLTVYSNINGEEILFEFYDAEKGRLLPVQQTIEFNNNQVFGSPLEPVQLDAGRLFITISPDSETEIFINDSEWSGESIVRFIAADLATADNYFDSDDVLLTVVDDHAPRITPIDDQTIFVNEEFSDFDLDDYLIELDGDSIIWSYSGNTFLQISISSDNIVSIISLSNEWTGVEAITFMAEDDTDFGAYDTEEVSFTVLEEDHPPQVSDIPDQEIYLGENFTDIELSSYLTELDDDEINWSYEFLENDDTENVPNWNVNPNDYQYTMNITAEVSSKGICSEGNTHILAAFSGTECRGIASAIYTLDKWLYFLTIYSNDDDDEIVFRFYDQGCQQNLPVENIISFESDVIIGNPLEPLQMYAGFIKIILEENFASINLIDQFWAGYEEVNLIATDIGTIQQLSGFDQVRFSVMSSPEFDLPESFTFNENESLNIDFCQYLSNADSQNFLLSVSGNQNVNVDIEEFSVTLSAIEDWSGSELITFYADDQQRRLTLSDTVEIIVTPVTGVTLSRELNTGWNWVSTNVISEDMSLNSVLSSIGENGVYIKNQTQFANYLPEFGWVGSLEIINNLNMYRLEMNNEDILELTGVPVDTQNLVYNLNSGWNWISYAPQEILPLNTALAALGDNGTNIKSQMQYAIYYPSTGEWLGSLMEMEALNGYLLNVISPGEFTYPGNVSRGSFTYACRESLEGFDPHQYLYNSSLLISSNDKIDETSSISAYCGNELRSTCEILDCEALTGRKYYAVMLYSNDDYEENLRFYYQKDQYSKMQELEFSVNFLADSHSGSIENPLFIELTPETQLESLTKPADLSVYPNPFNPSTTINYAVQKKGNVNITIYNIKGQEISELVNEVKEPGFYNYELNAAKLTSGIYYLKLQTGVCKKFTKIILMK